MRKIANARDACTDDSEAVVARFADPRIRLINLHERALVEALSHPAPTHLRMLRAGVLWKALGISAAARIALGLGGEPEAVYFYFNYPRRWGFLPRGGALFPVLYRRRGLPAWKDK